LAVYRGKGGGGSFFAEKGEEEKGPKKNLHGVRADYEKKGRHSHSWLEGGIPSVGKEKRRGDSEKKSVHKRKQAWPEGGEEFFSNAGERGKEKRHF